MTGAWKKRFFILGFCVIISSLACSRSPSAMSPGDRVQRRKGTGYSAGRGPGTLSDILSQSGFGRLFALRQGNELKNKEKRYRYVQV